MHVNLIIKKKILNAMHIVGAWCTCLVTYIETISILMFIPYEN